MGPSLLIAKCLIIAIRTARWPVRSESKASEMDLKAEIEHAARPRGRVLTKLVSSRSELFPSRKEAWCQPMGKLKSAFREEFENGHYPFSTSVSRFKKVFRRAL